MYVFISEREIMPYKGEILKRYAGNRLVKTIANPTDEDLSEFGYMPLVEDEIPEYDKQRQYLDYRYTQEKGVIKKSWTVMEVTESE